MREFLHLNGAPEIDAQPRVVGCETLKQAKRTRALVGTHEEKVFRPALCALGRGVHSAGGSGSQECLTKVVDEKNAVNIRRICVKRLVQGYDGFLLLILLLIQYRARREGAYIFGAGETFERRNNAPEGHPGQADDQQPRGQESKRYNTKIVQCAIPTETQQNAASLRRRVT